LLNTRDYILFQIILIDVKIIIHLPAQDCASSEAVCVKNVCFQRTGPAVPARSQQLFPQLTGEAGFREDYKIRIKS